MLDRRRVVHRYAWSARPAGRAASARDHGPSSSRTRTSTRWAASIAPTGSCGVLALVTEPLAGGGRRVPVGVGSQRRQSLRGNPGCTKKASRRRRPLAGAEAARVAGSNASSTRTRPEVYVAARIGAKLAQQHHQRAVSLAAADHHRVVQGDRHRGPGGVGQVRQGQPVRTPATARARTTSRRCSPRIVQSSPSAASSWTRESTVPSAIAARSSSARLVSSALSASIAANWPGRYARHLRPDAPGGRLRRGQRRHLASSPACASWILTELAHRLQHPVAHPGRALPDGQQ